MTKQVTNNVAFKTTVEVPVNSIVHSVASDLSTCFIIVDMKVMARPESTSSALSPYNSLP